MLAQNKPRRWAEAVLIALLISLINLLVWRVFNPPLVAPDVPARIGGLAYNGFQRWDSPLTAKFPDDAALKADLARLAPLSQRLRTYSASELPNLPALAAAQGFKLTAGVWLDKRLDNNERELAAIIAASRQHPVIERVIAGNETLLRDEMKPTALYAYLDRLRAVLKVPLSTAEPWHVWLKHPELASHVDFITIHLLPYWEGLPVDQALDYALERYSEVRERFPGRKIVIGEIGWPSNGDRRAGAEATPDNQALFVRQFLARASRLDLDYYLMEAVDQPWKRATERAVGAHWGLLDAARQAKFAFTGPLQADPYWQGKALLASLLGGLALLPFLLAFAPMRLAGRLMFGLSLQAVASFFVLLAALPLAHYLRPLDMVFLVLLVPALIMMGVILLVQIFEFAELYWPGSLQNQVTLQPLAADAPAPFVSIHLACCNEPPDMVIATIDSLLALDWPAFEIVVVDNNTSDAALWQPVEAHVQACLAAGVKAGLRFFHLPQWPGYKAGALNFALEQSDLRAQWIAVVDADYLVKTNWLRALGGYFSDPTVGVVQSPQAHRDWSQSTLSRMMNWEYDGFFRIGMHHRQERDAAIQHGTMTVIRASALRAVSGWEPACVCEDSELGLRLVQQGLRLVYVDEVLGSGLVPSDFSAYQRQRRRWAQGAMQILRRHRQALLGRSTLSLAQRYHFVAGWLPWVGDGLHLFFSLAAMLWTLGVLLAPETFGLPIAIFVVPLAVFFVIRLLLTPLLYRRRVPCSPADVAGAALAGIGLSHSVARGVFAGLFGKTAVFAVTRKGVGNGPRNAVGTSVRQEIALLAGLLLCIVTLGWQPSAESDLARWGWMLALGLQALPYAAAVLCASLPTQYRSKKWMPPSPHPLTTKSDTGDS
jgi:exo-beta-1,3-glucanase (GH17 family)/cellulose synthase/poly-beta-1,6-N-acetylglucosamine synthase-like glycosyltransferase